MEFKGQDLIAPRSSSQVGMAELADPSLMAPEKSFHQRCYELIQKNKRETNRVDFSSSFYGTLMPVSVLYGMPQKLHVYVL